MARAEYLRPFFEMRYAVEPDGEPGLRYLDLDLCYWEQRVAIGDHGVSVLDERRVVEATLPGPVLVLGIFRPVGTPNAAVELRPAFGGAPTPPALEATVLSRGALPGPSDPDERVPLRLHLLDHLVVRFEADLVLAFDPAGDRARALERARHRWGAVPVSTAPAPGSVVRPLLFDDLAYLVDGPSPPGRGSTGRSARGR